jgi:hypothetical protein
MHSIRAFLTGHRKLAALILVLALAMKVAVPPGYMVGAGDRTLTIEICTGQGDSTFKQISIPGKGGEKSDDHAKAAKECPYTALSMVALEGTDPLLLGLALAFILALGFAPAPPLRLARPGFLTPPLRGPPALS